MKIVLDKNPDLNERDLSNESIEKFRNSEPLENFGDGIKCFIGIMVATLSYPYRILLIDEPEAFLHPTAAQRLGHQLSLITEKKESSLVVATHSANFLMGCLQATNRITILRLTYDHTQGTVTQLDSNDIKELSTDPFLRSTDSLSTLFHNSGIICEAEKDKVFYQSINHKLLSRNVGIRDNIFLNVNGKDGVYKLLKPLRKTGIPIACIYDFDVIRTDKKNKERTRILWKNIVSACNIDEVTSKELEQQRQDIAEKLSNCDSGIDIFKNFNRDLVSSTLLYSIDSFLDKLSEYGIFIVPTGDLESWIPIRSKDSQWFQMALNWIETNDIQMDSNYPSIWSFMQKIKKWIKDQYRKGMSNYSQ